MDDMIFQLGDVDEKFFGLRKEMDTMSRVFFMQTIEKRKAKKPDMTPKIKFVESFPIFKNLLRKYIYVKKLKKLFF